MATKRATTHRQKSHGAVVNQVMQDFSVRFVHTGITDWRQVCPAMLVHAQSHSQLGHVDSVNVHFINFV
jgi:hypothetical protein